MRRDIARQKMEILNAIGDRGLTVCELSELLGLSDDTIRNRIKDLKDEVHICTWNFSYSMLVPVYRKGRKLNAVKPTISKDFRSVSMNDLMETIKEKPGRRSVEIARDLGASNRLVYKKLQKLNDKGCVEKRGRPKCRYFPVEHTSWSIYQECFNRYVKNKKNNKGIAV